MTGAYLALCAAHGRPRTTSREDIDRFGGIEGHDAWRARNAVRNLNGAVGATIATVALMAAATGMTWFAPAPKTPEHIEITLTSGAVVCGESRPASSGTMAVRLATGHVRTIRFTDVEALRPVASCPK